MDESGTDMGKEITGLWIGKEAAMKKKKNRGMTKKERVEAAISGAIVDTVPYTIRVSPPEKMTVTAHAEFTARTAREQDSDLLIAMHSDKYVQDFCGGENIFSQGEYQDWQKIKPLSVNRGILAEERDYLKCLLDKTKGEIPLLFTVLSPITAAFKLCPSLAEHIENGHGNEVRRGLAAITETTCAFVQRLIETGADGIFFVAEKASYRFMEENLYREYGMPYDLAVLSASSGWCNVLHAPGKEIMFPVLRKYPVQVFSWNDRDSLPSVREAAMLMDACLMIGPGKREITERDRNYIEYSLYNIMEQTNGKKVIVSAESRISGKEDEEIISFIRKAKKEIEEKVVKKNS